MIVRSGGWVQQHDADRLGRPARRHPAGRRVSLRAVHPGRGGAGPGPGARRRGAARPHVGSRRSARRHRHRPGGRERRAGRRPVGARRLAAVLRAGRPAPTSTIRRASPPGTRSSRPATARSRSPCRPTAATASSPTPSGCRPPPPPRSSWPTPTCQIGDVTITASAQLTVNVESSPGVPVTYAELVLIPVADPADDAGAPVPSLYSLFPGCAPMLGPPDGGSPACNRALTTNGSFNLALPPGQYYVYATRGPFSSLDRAEVDLAPGMSAPVTLVGRIAGLAAPAGRRRLGRLPRPRRRQLRLVDPRSRSGGQLSRHRRRRDHRDRPQRRHQLREHAGDAGRHELASPSSPASSRRPTSSGTTSPATPSRRRSVTSIFGRWCPIFSRPATAPPGRSCASPAS